MSISTLIPAAAHTSAFSLRSVGTLRSQTISTFTPRFFAAMKAFAIGYWSSSYQDVIVFCILIFVLLIRPSGIFGVPAPQKV